MKRIFVYIKNIYLSVPAIIVLLMVLGGFVVNCFVSNTFLLDNRPLFKKPTKFTSNFAKDFEQYYNDTFAGRKKLVKKFSKLKLKLGLDTGYTINGLDGWMFYDSAKVPDGYTLIDYYGEVSFSPEEEKQMAEGIEKAKDFYAKRGIDYIIAVVPNKEGLYSEYMPLRMQNARISDVSRTDRAIVDIKERTNVPIINWRFPLNEAKKKISYPLYFKMDSHWNNIGAYIAYKSLADTLHSMGYPLQVSEFENKMIQSQYAASSDLGVDGDHDIDFSINYKIDQHPQNIVDEDHGFFQIWENPKAAIQKRVLLIRDSMGIALMRYMQKDFAFGVYAHSKWNTKEGLKKLIETYKPDLVIDETGERYFNRFLKYKDLYEEK